MRISNPSALQARLRTLLAQCETKPSRQKLASDLQQIAEDLQAGDKGPNRTEPTDDEIFALTGIRVASSNPATWTKLRDGTWGIRCTSAMKPGDACVVQKRDGTKATVTLGREVWSGNGVWLFSINSPGGVATKKRAPGKSLRPYECEECGEFVRPGTSCWETGMAH
jgi:hypothetical protein